MSEYIKREDAIDAVDKCRRDTFQQLNGMKGYLTAIPSADVVEVVRCIDCKYRKPVPHCSYGECIYASQMVDHNDYCSYGERKGK